MLFKKFKMTDFNNYIQEISLEIPQKEKGKTKTLHFWNTEKCLNLFNALVENKHKGILPIGNIQKEDKEIIGLWDTLINPEHKEGNIKYPAYDLKVLFEGIAKEQNLINFVVNSKLNKAGKNSYLKVDFSQLEEE